MQSNNSDILESHIDLKTVLIWGAIIITAVAGAVFQLTKISMEDNLAALKTNLDIQRTKIENLENRPKSSTPSIRLSEAQQR